MFLLIIISFIQLIDGVSQGLINVLYEKWSLKLRLELFVNTLDIYKASLDNMYLVVFLLILRYSTSFSFDNSLKAVVFVPFMIHVSFCGLV